MTSRRLRVVPVCILAAVMGVAMAAAPAFASMTPAETAARLVARANAQITALVTGAQQLENATDALRGRDTDAPIAKALQHATDGIASATKAAVEALGFQVGCTYSTVSIGNVTVSIDPLEVIGW